MYIYMLNSYGQCCSKQSAIMEKTGMSSDGTTQDFLKWLYSNTYFHVVSGNHVFYAIHFLQGSHDFLF